MKTGAGTYSSAIEDANNYTAWVLDQFQGYIGDKVLEVGLGHGSYQPFLAHCDYTGADIDPSSIKNAKSRDPDGKYHQADLSQPSFSKTVGVGYDSVLCFNVIEHIKDDELALKHLFKVVKPGGHLLLLVPSHELLYSDMDTLAGHHRRYSKKMLLRRLPTGIKVIDAKYINPIGGLGWLANRLLTTHDDLDDESINRQIVLFDKYILPFSKFAGMFTKKIFGQSLICVVQK